MSQISNNLDSSLLGLLGTGITSDQIEIMKQFTSRNESSQSLNLMLEGIAHYYKNLGELQNIEFQKKLFEFEQLKKQSELAQAGAGLNKASSRLFAIMKLSILSSMLITAFVFIVYPALKKYGIDKLIIKISKFLKDSQDNKNKSDLLNTLEWLNEKKPDDNGVMPKDTKDQKIKMSLNNGKLNRELEFRVIASSKNETETEFHVPGSRKLHDALSTVNCESKFFEGLKDKSAMMYSIGPAGTGKSHIGKIAASYFKKHISIEIKLESFVPSDPDATSKEVVDGFRHNMDAFLDMISDLQKNNTEKIPLIINFPEFDKTLDSSNVLKITFSEFENIFFTNFINKITGDSSIAENQIKNILILMDANKKLEETAFFQERKISDNSDEMYNWAIKIKSMTDLFLNKNKDPNDEMKLTEEQKIKNYNDTRKILLEMFDSRTRGGINEFQKYTLKGSLESIRFLKRNEIYDEFGELFDSIQAQDDKSQDTSEEQEQDDKGQNTSEEGQGEFGYGDKQIVHEEEKNEKQEPTMISKIIKNKDKIIACIFNKEGSFITTPQGEREKFSKHFDQIFSYIKKNQKNKYFDKEEFIEILMLIFLFDKFQEECNEKYIKTDIDELKDKVLASLDFEKVFDEYKTKKSNLEQSIMSDKRQENFYDLSIDEDYLDTDHFIDELSQKDLELQKFLIFKYIYQYTAKTNSSLEQVLTKKRNKAKDQISGIEEKNRKIKLDVDKERNSFNALQSRLSEIEKEIDTTNNKNNSILFSIGQFLTQGLNFVNHNNHINNLIQDNGKRELEDSRNYIKELHNQRSQIMERIADSTQMIYLYECEIDQNEYKIKENRKKIENIDQQFTLTSDLRKTDEYDKMIDIFKNRLEKIRESILKSEKEKSALDKDTNSTMEEKIGQFFSQLPFENEEFKFDITNPEQNFNKFKNAIYKSLSKFSIQKLYISSSKFFNFRVCQSMIDNNTLFNALFFDPAKKKKEEETYQESKIIKKMIFIGLISSLLVLNIVLWTRYRFLISETLNSLILSFVQFLNVPFLLNHVAKIQMTMLAISVLLLCFIEFKVLEKTNPGFDVKKKMKSLWESIKKAPQTIQENIKKHEKTTNSLKLGTLSLSVIGFVALDIFLFLKLKNPMLNRFETFLSGFEKPFLSNHIWKFQICALALVSFLALALEFMVCKKVYEKLDCATVIGELKSGFNSVDPKTKNLVKIGALSLSVIGFVALDIFLFLKLKNPMLNRFETFLSGFEKPFLSNHIWKFQICALALVSFLALALEFMVCKKVYEKLDCATVIGELKSGFNSVDPKTKNLVKIGALSLIVIGFIALDIFLFLNFKNPMLNRFETFLSGFEKPFLSNHIFAFQIGALFVVSFLALAVEFMVCKKVCTTIGLDLVEVCKKKLPSNDNSQREQQPCRGAPQIRDSHGDQEPPKYIYSNYSWSREPIYGPTNNR